MDLLDKAAVSYQIVLTKADKIHADAVTALLATVREQVGKRAAAYPQVLATSSEKNIGIEELRAAILTAAQAR
jgi:GTP-binding protein